MNEKKRRLNSVNKNPISSDSYIKMEDRYYYQMERKFFIPILKNSKRISKYTEELCLFKNPIKGLKSLFSSFSYYYGLDNIEIKITQRKNLSSYYSSDKQCVFLNKVDIERFKNNPNEKNSFELIFLYLHEMAHAFVLSYFNDFSHHDAFYFKKVVDMYSFASDISFENFLNTKQNDFSLLEFEKRERFNYSNNSFLKEYIFETKDDALAQIEFIKKTKKECDIKEYSDVLNYLNMKDFVKSVVISNFDDNVELSEIMVFHLNEKYYLVHIDYVLFDDLRKESEHRFLKNY